MEDLVEDRAVSLTAEEADVDRTRTQRRHKVEVPLEVEAMAEVGSNLEEAATRVVEVATIREVNSITTMDSRERNSLEIVMVGRNLITTITDLTEVTGVPEAAPIHMSLPLNMFLGTITNGESHKESSV